MNMFEAYNAKSCSLQDTSSAIQFGTWCLVSLRALEKRSIPTCFSFRAPLVLSSKIE